MRNEAPTAPSRHVNHAAARHTALAMKVSGGELPVAKRMCG